MQEANLKNLVRLSSHDASAAEGIRRQPASRHPKLFDRDVRHARIRRLQDIDGRSPQIRIGRKPFDCPEGLPRGRIVKHNKMIECTYVS